MLVESGQVHSQSVMMLSEFDCCTWEQGKIFRAQTNSIQNQMLLLELLPKLLLELLLLPLLLLLFVFIT